MIKKLTSKIQLRSGLLRHSVAWFLGALIALFVTLPFIEEFDQGRLVETTMLTVMLGAAVLAVGGRRRTLLVGAALVGPVLIARWMHHFQSGGPAKLFFIVTFVVFLGFVISHFLRFILRSPRVTSEVLCAAVATYLLMALLWAAAYTLLAQLRPGAFTGLPAGSPPLNGFDALYFSLITLTTVGYGDIMPAYGPARMLAMMEATCGTMYMAVLVARLVSVYSTENDTKPPGDQ
jgi:voltage-gated potassium channel